MPGVERIAHLPRITAVALVCGWGLTYLMPPLNGDVAAILLFALRMVRGDALYVDIIDVNPPLIFWLNLAPAWLAELLGSSPAFVLSLALIVLQPVAILLSFQPLKRIAPFQDVNFRWFLGGALLFVLFIVPMGSFGQREPLMTTLALPYLAVMVVRHAGAPVSPGAAGMRAALGAIGFLIKPYFLLVPLLLELRLLARCGWRAWAARPEPWVIAGTATAYILAVAWLHPVYLDDVLPLVARYYLTPGLSDAALRVFGAPDRLIALSAVVPLVAYAIFQRGNPLLPVFGMFAVAMAGSALVQGKGWPYHLVPLWQAATLIFALMAKEILQLTARRRLLSQVGEHAVGMSGLTAAILVLGSLAPPLADRLDYQGSFAGRLEPLLAREARGRNVLWLTDAIYPKYPVILYENAAPASRFMELWLIDGLYRAQPGTQVRPAMRSPAQMSTDEHRLFDIVGTSLERARPALVLIASAAAELSVRHGSFDYLAYFLRHPSFAREWRHYRQVAEVDGTRIYRREAVP